MDSSQSTPLILDPLPGGSVARAVALDIYSHVLNGVRGDVLVKNHLRLDGDDVAIGNAQTLMRGRRVHVVAIGKASVSMAEGAMDVLGEQVVGGLVVTKSGSGRSIPRLDVVESSHPVPDEASLAAGQRLLDYSARVKHGDLVLVLLSGGASSLAESLKDGITLLDIQDRNRRLLSDLVDIHAINQERAGFSKLKHGGLGRAFAHVETHVLVLSDVIGNDLQTIGSGPFVDTHPLVPHTIIGDLALALRLAEEQAAQRGTVLRLPPLTGEAHFEAERICHAWFNGIVVTGGETVVQVRGKGLGGRCQEFACAASQAIQGQSEVAVLAGSTDGTDGPTTTAGGLVDGESLTRARHRGLDATLALADNDSNAFLAACDGLLTTGPTGSNVNDLYLIVRLGRGSGRGG